MDGLDGRKRIFFAAFAFIAPLLACGPPKDTRSCADMEETVNAVRGLSRLDWAVLDDEAIRSVWPLARDLRSFCEGCSPIESARVVLSCCRECDVCPSIHFEVPGDARTPLKALRSRTKISSPIVYSPTKTSVRVVDIEESD